MRNNKDVDSLSHTTWRCQYHVVFAPKYRRMVVYGQIKKDIGQILRQLCEQKGIEIIEAEACPDHIHMLISFSPKYSIAYVMGYLKGKSSLMIFDRHANLKYKYGNRHFWARGYFVDTVGKNKKRIGWMGAGSPGRSSLVIVGFLLSKSRLQVSPCVILWV